MLLRVGAPVFAGVGFLIFALVLWVWGERRRSLPLRWISLGQLAFALCAGFAAVAQLATPRTFALWSDLSLAAWLLAVCALLVGGVYGIRDVRRGSRLRHS
ncbi:MAG TPA: hypothetical protein VF808_05015 [Ktedonobacterales bacterium]